jgi:hypothetical protein
MSTGTEHQLLNAPAMDARDLQLHLYRQIGISAVAAALECRLPVEPALDVGPTPAMVVRDVKAA